MNDPVQSIVPPPQEVESSLLRSRHRGVHPPMVADFKPKKSLPPPKIGTVKEYADLNDKSTYSEYAWEFLRRNRFYQSMVDLDVPGFDINHWGYKATPMHEASFGLKLPKHYKEKHGDKPPKWAPIEAINERMQVTLDHFKHSNSNIEYPREQVAIVFDLSPMFGPGTRALQTQADLAVKHIEKWLRSSSQKVAGNVPTEFTNKPNLQLLRAYLTMADLLSSSITIEQAAQQLPKYDEGGDERKPLTDRQRIDRAYRYTDKAKLLIYGWECLGLLKFDKWDPPSP